MNIQDSNIDVPTQANDSFESAQITTMIHTPDMAGTIPEDKPCGPGQPPVIAEHPDADEIRRQVEFYFSDENLPMDAHMLMKTGGAENLPVSIKHILGFARMRKYKPRLAVVESLKKCTTLVVVDNKYLKRKIPLTLEPKVTPQQLEEAHKEEIQKKNPPPVIHQPWMTKGMRKPTGFEEYWADTPVTPAEFAKEQDLYHPNISFESRIETAISRFMAKRKFHQRTALIFTKFLKYGGIDCSPKQFSGGLDANDLQEKDAAQIAAMTAIHRVADEVITRGDKWEVDFEGVARGFLSSESILNHLRFSTKADILATTSILRNFYNYLMHHNVCLEYTGQILGARAICDLADIELYRVIYVYKQLPGDYNSAVSRLYHGASAAFLGEGQTWDGAENFGGSVKDSQEIMMTAIGAHGTECQRHRASQSLIFDVVFEEQVCFVIEKIELPDNETCKLYEEAAKTRPFLKTVGKLHCRRWTYPLAPRNIDAGTGGRMPDEAFTLFIECDILEYCFAGMKVEAVLRGLDIGIKWLDRICAVSPSFFTLLPNEFWSIQKAVQRERNGFHDDEPTSASGDLAK